MDPLISDPDTKINMSLDEIIRLTPKEINNKVRGVRKRRNKAKFSKQGDSDYSVPLLTSAEGVSIYVTKKSPLLNPDIKQSFLNAIKNRALNAELLEKSSRIIPAKYKLVKTNNGVERILVPVKNYVCKPFRKLYKTNNLNCNKSAHDEIPPLVSVPLLKPVNSSSNPFKQKMAFAMEVDNAEDDDVVVLSSIKKEPEFIDVEMNMPVTVLENKNSQFKNVKTLNDRFTRLTGEFQF